MDAFRPIVDINMFLFLSNFLQYNQLCIAVLSQRGPRDAAVHFDTYQILQRHRAVSLPQHAYCWSLSADCSELSVKSDKY